jgi:DNA-binding beta-propeller fold protein YncE
VRRRLASRWSLSRQQHRFVTVLNIPVNDIAYDKVSKKLFASIPSVAGLSGNSVTEIDPVTATLGTSVFVGSEPNKIAVSDDGQTVYVGIDGAASVRRVDVASHTATTQFRLGSVPFDGTPFTAADMIVVPGNANAVAVARMQPGLSPPGKGVVIYDNGVARPNIGQSPWQQSNLPIVWSDSRNALRITAVWWQLTKDECRRCGSDGYRKHIISI